MKKLSDIRVKNGKIEKNPRGTREANQDDLKRNLIMIGLLPLLPKCIFFLLGQSSKIGHDNAPLSLCQWFSLKGSIHTLFKMNWDHFKFDSWEFWPRGTAIH